MTNLLSFTAFDSSYQMLCFYSDIFAAVVNAHSLPRLPLSGAASVGAPNIVLPLSCNALDSLRIFTLMKHSLPLPQVLEHQHLF
jgi:hypothetical protein